MATLTERQQEVLAAVVQMYVRTGEPVASKTLCDEVGFECSPATMRNEMATLEKQGYLTHPHTSSGRVPTDKGYRLFVDLHGQEELTRVQQQQLQQEFLKLQAKYARLAKLTSRLLAQEAKGVGFSALPEADVSYAAGMSNLLNSPDLSAADQVAEAAEVLEQLDERSEEILTSLEKQGSEIEVYIGKENPLFQMQHVSIILAPTQFPEGGKGFVAVVGPKRMPYSRNVSLLSEIKRLLSGGNTGLCLLLIGSTLIIF